MKIGPYTLKNPWILAPMAGVSEMPFRLLARRMGAAAAPTELVSAKGLVYGQARTQQYLQHAAEEQPFWVQLFGGDEASMVAGGARAVEMGAKILDINMGCPVRKVTRHGAGSGLLCDPERAAGLVRAMARSLSVPITVKIRAGWDAHTLNFVDMAKRLADAGAVAIAMHARTRAQAYAGQAHWDWIAELVAQAPIPVIGNGDAFTAAKARALKEQTGCAAVMVGRGALGNPWIFRALTAQGDPHAATQEYRPSPHERWQVVRAHLEAHLEHVGDALRAIKRFRPHLMWYARGVHGASRFRAQITQIESLSPLLAECEAFFTAAPVPADDGAAEDDVEFNLANALG